MILHTNPYRLIVLLSTVVSAFAVEYVFNANICGPNSYGEIVRRPSIGRLKEFPWLARLGYRRNGVTEFHFQGTLIHPYYVVTTVFATDYYQNTLEFVRLGEYHTTTDEDCQELDGDEICAPALQDIPIEQIIKHPEHNNPKLANDLALIKLQRPANISSEFVRPICVPTGEDFPLTENAPLFIAAWCGSKKSGISVVPLQYRMQMVSAGSCARKLSPHVDIDLHAPSQFCAALDVDKKTQEKHKDISLRGSTGAPLQMLGPDGRVFLVGMTSVGVRNAALDTPYVFVNLVRMAGWLEQTVMNEEQNRLNARVQ
ncbi:phenoloxidase-activating enzyme 1-like [Toxorhynchites rutilus septentrionalis]|uniref:phenoloxidase-activating enzyme 1-like n=1 Tax=Toxorhynchites rutilus septentrionalis TaxID=329112 RepID=UPI00247A5D93|nr:phenoloxidase-activating enzyme 1-like [Toxorhynchites rutilus septentrionalis]